MNDSTSHYGKVLAYLRKHGSMATREGRQILEIPSICDVVYQLRRHGHNIETVWIYQPDARGEVRRVGKYLLKVGG